jgi:hypothetical protein
MMPRTIFSCAIRILICVLVVTLSCNNSARETARSKVEQQEKTLAGKEPAAVQRIPAEVKPKEKGPAVLLALKFAPQDSTTYRVVVEADRSVVWEGPLPEKPTGFKGGHTGNRIETTFAQRIQSVDDKGNAIAEIKIEALKYLAKVRDDVVLDFDSSREKDKDNLLAKLIGQSYTIQISPAGQVLQVVDANQARAAVEGSSSAHQTASALFSAEAIKQRHTIPALPPGEKNRLSPGESWSSTATFPFDMMGSKSYEKIYTLKEIKDADDRQFAVADMNAVPSSEMAQELHKEQTTNPLEKMFDTNETYSGQLKLDLTAGKVEKCLEELRIEWVIVDPQAKDDKEPAALRMSAMRLYSIEKID